MKTKTLTLALLLAVLFSGTLIASEPVPAPKAISSSVATLIQNEMEYPEFAIEDKFEGKVILQLEIEEEGSFRVIAANSINNDLKEYAAKMVENIETDEFKNFAGQSVIIKLNYDLKLY